MLSPGLWRKHPDVAQASRPHVAQAPRLHFFGTLNHESHPHSLGLSYLPKRGTLTHSLQVVTKVT